MAAKKATKRVVKEGKHAAKKTVKSARAKKTKKTTRSTYVLGIGCFYHDSSAALIKDGEIVAAAQEERFTRKKHDTGFPEHAIAWCMDSQKISWAQLNHIAFYEKPMLKFERLLFQHIECWPKSFKTFLSSTPTWINQKLRALRSIRKMKHRGRKYKGDVLFVQHHMAHAASSFLLSPFKEAAILTVDGVGEWTTTALGRGRRSNGGGNARPKITLEKEIRFPNSIGLLYSTITAYLGFSVNNSEYKVMGLAPYGTMDRTKNKYYARLKRVIDIKPDGSYRMNMRYFTYVYKDRMPSKELCTLLGGPVRHPDDKLTGRHKDIAAALQLITEECVQKILTHLHEMTGSENLVLAGGVALNSVNNGKILRNTPFKNIWIQPDAGDGGTSMGAAAYAYSVILGKGRVKPFTDAYLGPAFSHKEVERFLKRNRITYHEFKDDQAMIRGTAKLLAEDNVIGWFQKGMEWGPRALGARSILSNPCNTDMQEILNLKVKHREKFRPFAPVVCADDAKKYFDCDEPVPEPTDYMLMVYPIFKEWHKKIPSVTHVDGSGRLQTIRSGQNKQYYDLIKEFGKHTGIPILINTSFNIRGEPIVCTPFDAYKCMMGTGIDYLVIDRFLVKREENPQDMWDSEKYAKD